MSRRQQHRGQCGPKACRWRTCCVSGQADESAVVGSPFTALGLLVTARCTRAGGVGWSQSRSRSATAASAHERDAPFAPRHPVCFMSCPCEPAPPRAKLDALKANCINARVSSNCRVIQGQGSTSQQPARGAGSSMHTGRHASSTARRADLQRRRSEAIELAAADAHHRAGIGPVTKSTSDCRPCVIRSKNTPGFCGFAR
jgi:hypothetical protein